MLNLLWAKWGVDATESFSHHMNTCIHILTITWHLPPVPNPKSQDRQAVEKKMLTPANKPWGDGLFPLQAECSAPVQSWALVLQWSTSHNADIFIAKCLHRTTFHLCWYHCNHSSHFRCCSHFHCLSRVCIKAHYCQFLMYCCGW